MNLASNLACTFRHIKQKMFLTILTIFFLLTRTVAQEASRKIPTDGNKYNLENCINQFDMNQSTKTAVGYQYWFIAQNFLEDGLTVKMSVVGPKLATHAPHRHAGDEIYYVLEGTAQFYLDGKTATGGANTTFYCPENSEHGISNAGNRELKYLVIRKYPKKEK